MQRDYRKIAVLKNLYSFVFGPQLPFFPQANTTWPHLILQWKTELRLNTWENKHCAALVLTWTPSSAPCYSAVYSWAQNSRRSLLTAAAANERQYIYKCETGGRIIKLGFGKLLPPVRCLAPSSPSILMALQSDCRRWEKHNVWVLCLFYGLCSCRDTPCDETWAVCVFPPSRESRASPSHPEPPFFTPSLVVVVSLATFSVKESHGLFKFWINKDKVRTAERAGWHRNAMETEEKKNMSKSGGHLHQSDEALRENGSHAATLTTEGWCKRRLTTIAHPIWFKAALKWCKISLRS